MIRESVSKFQLDLIGEDFLIKLKKKLIKLKKNNKKIYKTF